MYYGYERNTGFGQEPYVFHAEEAAQQNQNFRMAVWTGCHLQMTLMCIQPCGEIGLENHPDTDQMIRIEHGCASVRMGKCRSKMDFCRNLQRGDVVFVPAGIWHNVTNTGRDILRVSSVYGPAHHPWGTVQKRKEKE